MIRVRVFRDDERHPVKAWRVEEPGWTVVNEVINCINKMEEGTEVRVVYEEISAMRQHELNMTITQVVVAPHDIFNGFTTLRKELDLVQDRINKGQY